MMETILLYYIIYTYIYIHIFTYVDVYIRLYWRMLQVDHGVCVCDHIYIYICRINK